MSFPRLLRQPFLRAAVLLISCVPAVGAAEGVPVRGRVLSNAGEPLADASVELFPGAADSTGTVQDTAAWTGTWTDEDGFFELAGRAGMARVVARAPGRLAMVHRLLPLDAETTLPAVELPEDAGLEVRLVGPGGEGVRGAIRVLTPDATRDGWQPAERRVATDDEGRARLPRAAGEHPVLTAFASGLAPGVFGPVDCGTVTLPLEAGTPWTVQVVDTSDRPVSGAVAGHGAWIVGLSGSDGRLQVRVPAGGLDLDLRAPNGEAARRRITNAVPVDGIPRHAALTVRLEPAAELRGRVLDAAQAPIADARVWPDGDSGAVVLTDGDGRYRLKTASSRVVRLRAAAPSFFSESLGLGFVEGGVQPVPTVVLERQLFAGGRVTDEDGQPLARVEVAVRYAPAGSRSSALRDRSGGLALSREDGRFVLPGLLAEVPYQAFFRPTRDQTGTMLAPATAEVPGHRPDHPPADLAVILGRGRRAAGRVFGPGDEPLAGVRVVLEAVPSEDLRTRLAELLEPERLARSRAVTTDWGRFVLQGLAPGRYVLRISAPGYAPVVREGVFISSAPADRRRPSTRFMRGRVVDLGTVRMQRGMAVEGIVRDIDDPDGEGLAGVAVHLRADDEDAAMLAPTVPELEPQVATTDDLGHFVLPDRLPGKLLTLVFRRRGYLPAEKQVVVGEDEPDVALEAARSFSGRVVNAYGEPLAGALVELETPVVSAALSMADGGVHHALCDENGVFTFEAVPPGRLDVNVYAAGHQRSHHRVNTEEEEEGQALAIRLTPGTALNGTVLAPDGSPVRGAQVSLSRSANGNGGPSSWTDSDGYFRLAGLPAGPRILTARHPAFGRTAHEVEVGAGTEAVLRFAGGRTLAGRVLDRDGGLIAGADVSLVPARERREGQHATSRADGSFVFRGLVAGEYQLWVRKAGYERPAAAHLVEVGGEDSGPLDLRLVALGED